MTSVLGNLHQHAAHLLISSAACTQAIGFIKAMQDYNRDAIRKIPYTNMRGNSDYSHEPLQYLGNGNWTYNHYPGGGRGK